MTKKSSTHKSGRLAYYRETGGALETGYLKVQGWGAKLNVFERMKRSQADVDRVFVARAAFELAVFAHDTRTKEDLLQEAVELASTSFNNPMLQTGSRITAAIHHANLPLLNFLHIEKKHPPLELVEKAHMSLSSFMLKNILAGNAPINSQIRERVGFSAEAYSIILLQRYQTEQMGSSNWTPVPALLSEDHSKHIGSGIRNCWDLSIFTNDLDDPAYKIQITTRPKNPGVSGTEKIYNVDNIAVIHPLEDLRPCSSARRLSIGFYGQVAVSHVSPPQEDIDHAKVVSEMTDRLLVAIDQ